MARTLTLVAVVLALIALQFFAARAPQNIATPSETAPADQVEQATMELAAWPAGTR